jgi:hypothetical protein
VTAAHPRLLGTGRRWGAFGVLALALGAVTGCAGVHPGAAAIVNGTTISESDLDAVSRDLQPYLQPGQQLPRENVLTALIMQPFIADRLKAANKMVSMDEAAQALHQVATRGDSTRQGLPGPDQWATPTKALAQAQVGMEGLTPVDQERVLGALSTAKVQVNPKYGTFQLPGRVVPAVENWIATPAPTAGGTAPAPQPAR